MSKRKKKTERQSMVDKTLHRKLKIEHPHPHPLKTGVNSDVSEGFTVSAPLITPFVTGFFFYRAFVGCSTIQNKFYYMQRGSAFHQ